MFIGHVSECKLLLGVKFVDGNKLSELYITFEKRREVNTFFFMWALSGLDAEATTSATMSAVRVDLT